MSHINIGQSVGLAWYKGRVYYSNGVAPSLKVPKTASCVDVVCIHTFRWSSRAELNRFISIRVEAYSLAAQRVMSSFIVVMLCVLLRA